MDKESPIKIDTTAGSRTYNRLDMQVSQTLHMAIELYDDLNYLFILDHYDDITLFDFDAEPLVVSYYQIKTSEDTITIDSAIKENWIAKLYAQLSRPEEWLVKELGLITNTPLKCSFEVKSKKGKKYKKEELLSAEHTSFSDLNESVQGRVKADIAFKYGIGESEVDISKFAHLRTTLTIDRHKDLVEKEMEDFLYEKYPRITVDTVKGIYSTVIDILTKRQKYEKLSDSTPFTEVKKYKGFTKSDLSKVIDKAIMLSIPTFDDVMKVSGVSPAERGRVSLPYTQILTDSWNKNDGSFQGLFNFVLDIYTKKPYDGKKTPWEYGLEIAEVTYKNKPIYKMPYDCDYIATLVICILINDSRR